MTERTHFVYTAWDGAGRVLYVGCTKDLRRRIQSHRGDKSDWLPYAVRYTMSGPFPQATALRIERERIVGTRPYFNWLPSHAAGIQALWRAGYTFMRPAARARLDRQYGADLTREGRLRIYRELIGEARAPRRKSVAA